MAKNPNGPYPGRQLFLGLLTDGRPCLAYLVTGRNPASRERRAVPVDSGIRIGPLGKQEYDPLRHYTGVKFDNLTGLAVVSNGIQTEAIYETYRLLFNTNSTPARGYMKKIMDGAGAEPDSYHTPRIAGAVISRGAGKMPVCIVSIKTADASAGTFQIKLEPGVMLGVSTYQGDLNNPAPFDANAGLARLEFGGKTEGDLAEYLFDISQTSYNGEDIRVCTIGGVCSGDGAWRFQIKNRHQAE